jgi:hypothetical protein
MKNAASKERLLFTSLSDSYKRSAHAIWNATPMRMRTPTKKELTGRPTWPSFRPAPINDLDHCPFATRQPWGSRLWLLKVVAN